jgi:CBS domain-containing protein
MKGVKVKDVMTRGVVSVEEGVSVKDAASVLADYDISGVVVIKEGELVGLLSEIDIVKVADREIESIKVADIMTKPVVTCRKEDDVEKASALMREHGIHRLVVEQEVKVEEGVKQVPAGVISASDIVKAIAGRR